MRTTIVDTAAAKPALQLSDSELWLRYVLPTLTVQSTAWLDYTIRFKGNKARPWKLESDLVDYWKPRRDAWLASGVESGRGLTDGVATSIPWTSQEILANEGSTRQKNTRTSLSRFRTNSKLRIDKQIQLVDNIAFKSNRGSDAFALAVRREGKTIASVDGQYVVQPAAAAPVYKGFAAVTQSSSRTRRRAREKMDSDCKWFVQDANGVHIVETDPGDDVFTLVLLPPSFSHTYNTHIHTTHIEQTYKATHT
jgi:hypothetical protein